MRQEEMEPNTDRVNRALMISNSILTVLSIIVTVVDIVKTVLFR